MTHMEQAKAVVEFAKANGFPDASFGIWDYVEEHLYESADSAMDGWLCGDEADFEIIVAMGKTRFVRDLRVESDGSVTYFSKEAKP